MLPAMDESPAVSSPEPGRRRDPVLAVLLGWLIPGFGHVYVGRPWKGLLYLAIIGAVFGGGLLLSRGLCVTPEREPVWFVGQAFGGIPAGLAAWMTRDLVPHERLATFDVGLLYTTVGGLLNLVAISDVLGIVDVRNRTWEAWRRDQEMGGDGGGFSGMHGAMDVPPQPGPDAVPTPDPSHRAAPAFDSPSAADVPPWELPPPRPETPR
jgi:TM2 domain-containing membrane protein YozV